MNIPDMIRELRASGMTQTQIAERVGVSQPAIHRAEKGSGVLYDVGKKLERLYEEVTGKSVAAAA